MALAPGQQKAAGATPGAAVSDSIPYMHTRTAHVSPNKAPITARPMQAGLLPGTQPPQHCAQVEFKSIQVWRYGRAWKLLNQPKQQGLAVSTVPSAPHSQHKKGICCPVAQETGPGNMHSLLSTLWHQAGQLQLEPHILDNHDPTTMLAWTLGAPCTERTTLDNFNKGTGNLAGLPWPWQHAQPYKHACQVCTTVTH